MKDKGYIFRVIRHASFGRLFKVIGDVHERSGKSRIATFFDILYCMKKYGAGYFDYYLMHNMGKDR